MSIIIVQIVPCVFLEHVIFTGFQEKLNWVFAYFLAPCATEGELGESPHSEASDDDEHAGEEIPSETGRLETEQSASTFLSSAEIQLGRENIRNEFDVTPSPNYDEEDEAPDSEEKFGECMTTYNVSQIVDNEENLSAGNEDAYTHRVIEQEVVIELQNHEELFTLAPTDLNTADITQQTEVNEKYECHSETENELEKNEEELQTPPGELNLTTSNDVVTEVIFVEEGAEDDTKIESPQEQSSESSSSSTSSDEIEYITTTATEITGSETPQSDRAVERDDSSDANEVIDAELTKDAVVMEESATVEIQQENLETEITTLSESSKEDTAFDDTPTSDTQQGVSNEGSDPGAMRSQPNIPTIAITEVAVHEVEYAKQEKQVGGDATSSYSSSSLRSSKKGDKITKGGYSPAVALFACLVAIFTVYFFDL